jgi:DNA recombination protein RmuC
MTALLAVLAIALCAALYLLRARGLELLAESRLRSALEAQLAAERKASEEKIALIEANEKRIEDSFAALSRKALQENRDQFLEQAVRPIGEQLEKVDSKIQDLEKGRAALMQQLGGLLAQTGSLARALRAPQARGRWGELQLKRVVELAGMLEKCDFTQQETLQGDEGRLRPDLIVHLPGGKRLVVDAKVPLTAYLDSLEAQTEDERRALLRLHARHLRNHVGELARKAYWDQLEHSPEFVVLFVPNEAIFATAMEQDPQLMEGAFSEKVLLASPTTLIALLRAAAFGWRQERLAEDAQAIASLGRELHKRLGRMADHFARVGKGLASAVGAYNETVGSLERMVAPAARRLGEKAAPSEPVMDALPDVDVTPRALRPADAPLPDDAN